MDTQQRSKSSAFRVDAYALCEYNFVSFRDNKLWKRTVIARHAQVPVCLDVRKCLLVNRQVCRKIQTWLLICTNKLVHIYSPTVLHLEYVNAMNSYAQKQASAILEQCIYTGYTCWQQRSQQHELQIRVLIIHFCTEIEWYKLGIQDRVQVNIGPSIKERFTEDQPYHYCFNITICTFVQSTLHSTPSVRMLGQRLCLTNVH